MTNEKSRYWYGTLYYFTLCKRDNWSKMDWFSSCKKGPHEWPIQVSSTSLTSYQLTCMLGEKRVTFFSFWISDATPEIPTRDFELVRWTLRTLQRIAHRYWHQCFFSFYEKMSTQDKQIMDQHENKLEYHHQRNFAKHQFRKGSNIEKEPIRL